MKAGTPTSTESPLFDTACRHAAGYNQAVAMRFLQVFPGPQAAGFLRATQQDVTFRLHSLAIHHDVDLIAYLHVDGAVRLGELFDGD